MSIYQELEHDHRKVKDTIKDLIAMTDADKRKSTFAELKRELDVHTAFEEETFYPKARAAAHMDDEIDDAIEEHHEAEVLLEQLAQADPESDEWEDMIEQLEDVLTHHINEEEQDIFAKAKRSISDSEATAMAESYKAMKQGRRLAGE
jgi:hemerythrin superfamily protein